MASADDSDLPTPALVALADEAEPRRELVLSLLRSEPDGLVPTAPVCGESPEAPSAGDPDEAASRKGVVAILAHLTKR